MVSFVDNPVKSRGGSRGGEKGDYFPPISLSLHLSAVMCSRFFVVKLFFSFAYFFLG